MQSCCFATLNLLFLTVPAKKCTKKRDARAELLFCQSKSIVFGLYRQRNVQKSVMHVKRCCFANLNLLLFCRSR